MTTPPIASFEDLLAALSATPRSSPMLLVAIDGCGGSGKSTFAAALAALRRDARVVHMDDFFLPSSARAMPPAEAAVIGRDFDWRRVASEVLDPLRGGRPARYRRYDWATDRLAECLEVPAGGLVIVEGVYSSRRELRDAYDYRIWVDCPRDVRLARGLARDGEAARAAWESDWMPAEDRYVEAHRPEVAADLVIDGSGRVECPRATHYVRLARRAGG